jgi:hypothetical protein
MRKYSGLFCIVAFDMSKSEKMSNLTQSRKFTQAHVCNKQSETKSATLRWRFSTRGSAKSALGARIASSLDCSLCQTQKQWGADLPFDILTRAQKRTAAAA